MTKKRKKKKGISENSLKNLKSWKPGQSGNPEGPPKGIRSFDSILKEFLNKNIKCSTLFTAKEFPLEDATGELQKRYTIKEAIGIRLIILALQGNMHAINTILDRFDIVPRGQDESTKVRIGQVILNMRANLAHLETTQIAQIVEPLFRAQVRQKKQERREDEKKGVLSGKT